MIQYNVFPGATRRVVTFSYDDGHPLDVRIVEMLNRHSLKGTFHIMNIFSAREDGEELFRDTRELYAGHEISCHTKTHNHPPIMANQSIINETIDNRRYLEHIAGYPVVGMSYPFGTFDDRSIEVMRSCGIVYGRNTLDTGRFTYPTDFMRWRPTCHHSRAGEHCDIFLREINDRWADYGLFYIWGHSHDIGSEEKWQKLEDVMKRLSEYRDKIWFATNIEYYNYVKAQYSLRVSTDECFIRNPSAIDVWIERDYEKICIPAGQTVVLPENDD